MNWITAPKYAYHSNIFQARSPPYSNIPFIQVENKMAPNALILIPKNPNDSFPLKGLNFHFPSLSTNKKIYSRIVFDIDSRVWSWKQLLNIGLIKQKCGCRAYRKKIYNQFTFRLIFNTIFTLHTFDLAKKLIVYRVNLYFNTCDDTANTRDTSINV